MRCILEVNYDGLAKPSERKGNIKNDSEIDETAWEAQELDSSGPGWLTDQGLPHITQPVSPHHACRSGHRWESATASLIYSGDNSEGIIGKMSSINKKATTGRPPKQTQRKGSVHCEVLTNLMYMCSKLSEESRRTNSCILIFLPNRRTISF